MSSHRVLAIDCGSSHVAVGVFSRKSTGRMLLEHYAVGEFAVEPSDELAWYRALEQTLNGFLRRKKYAANDCVVAVPGHLALTKLVKTPSIAREQRQRIVQFEASQNIPYPLEEVSWGHLEVADDGVDLELMLSAVKLDAIESICEAVDLNGAEATRCETASLALWRAMQLAGGNTPAVLVDVGGRSTQLIFAGGGGMHLRTLSLGGNMITAAVAAKLQIDFVEAEKLKLQVLRTPTSSGVDAITRDAVQQAVAEFNERLQLEIIRSRLAYLRQPHAVAPEKLLLCGSAANAPQLAETLKTRLGLRVEPFVVSDALNITTYARESAAGYEGSLAVLSGLAAGVLLGDERVLDLLPEGRRAAQDWRQRRTWWLAAAILFALLPAPFLLHYRLAAAQLKTQTTAIESELAPLRMLANRNAVNLDKLEALQKRAAALSELTENRDNWVKFLADLQQRLTDVGDVWLDTVHEAERDTTDDVPAPRQLVLGGWLLDTTNPLSSTGGAADEKVRKLFKSLTESPFVQSVGQERFDNSRPGLLRFDVVVELNPERRL